MTNNELRDQNSEAGIVVCQKDVAHVSGQVVCVGGGKCNIFVCACARISVSACKSALPLSTILLSVQAHVGRHETFMLILRHDELHSACLLPEMKTLQCYLNISCDVVSS